MHESKGEFSHVKTCMLESDNFVIILTEGLWLMGDFIYQSCGERGNQKVVGSVLPTRGYRHGYVFPLILLATMAVGMFIITMTQFQSSNRLKYQHLNDYQTAFNIAYSALVEVLADIQTKQWSNRSFKSKPLDRSAALFGGNFEMRVENHATVEFAFNVKIRVTYKSKRHLFYWRLVYNPNILDFTRLFVPVYYEDFTDPAAVPSDLDEQVDKLIRQREENQPKVREIAKVIKDAPKVADALKKVGISPDGTKQANKPRPEGPNIIVPETDLPLKKISELVAAITPAQTHVIKNFNFAIAAESLNNDQKELLVALAEVLQNRPSLRLELHGHCDAVGDAAYNLQLSIDRANSVKTYLVLLGIDASRLTVKGFGETRPIASNDTEAGKQKNRRVEFIMNG